MLSLKVAVLLAIVLHPYTFIHAIAGEAFTFNWMADYWAMWASTLFQLTFWI
jgi:hypothetical protein